MIAYHPTFKDFLKQMKRVHNQGCMHHLQKKTFHGYFNIDIVNTFQDRDKH